MDWNDLSFAHDGSIAPLLGLLQIDNPVWPGMGSEVVFELWQSGSGDTSGDEGKYFIRVLWGGQPLKTSTPMGILDMIPIEVFDGYIDGMMPEDCVGVCNA
jgi:hypothetical protein